jgi:hypothetical protein
MNIGRRRYTRKLSVMERLALTLNETCNYDVAIAVAGHGALSVAALRTAVSTAAAANPGCRVRLRGVLGWARWADSGIDPEVLEVQASNWDGFSQDNAPFLQQRFAPLQGGPICQLVYVHGDPSRIVFRASHAAIDGRSIMHFMQEVFRALRAEALLGSPCTLCDRDIMLKFQDKVNLQAIEPLPNTPHLPIIPCSRPLPGLPRYVWRAVVLPSIVQNLLPKFAIFLADYARRHSQGSVVFTVPVDLRTLREEVLSLGNLTGYLSVPVAPGDTARDFSRRLSQRTRNYVDCYWPATMDRISWMPIALLSRHLRKSQPKLYQASQGVMSGGLVSMGNYSLSSFSASDFDAVQLTPIPGFAGKINVVGINVAEATTVTFAVPESYTLDGQFDALLANFVAKFGKAREGNVTTATQNDLSFAS